MATQIPGAAAREAPAPSAVVWINGRQAIVAAVGFRNFLKRQPRPFDATLRALKEDKQCLHEEN